MKYETGADFRRALEDRLLAHCRSTSMPLIRLRRTVVFDRLLARLLAFEPGAWETPGAWTQYGRNGTVSVRAKGTSYSTIFSADAARTDQRMGVDGLPLSKAGVPYPMSD